jgi:hypothetical protein
MKITAMVLLKPPLIAKQMIMITMVWELHGEQHNRNPCHKVLPVSDLLMAHPQKVLQSKNKGSDKDPHRTMINPLERDIPDPAHK